MSRGLGRILLGYGVYDNSGVSLKELVISMRYTERLYIKHFVTSIRQNIRTAVLT